MTEANIPWLNRPAIYEHILAHIDPGTGRLRPDGRRLPDEARQNTEGGLRWMAGALDGAFGHHFSGADEGLAARIAELARTVGHSNSLKAKITLYELLLDNNLLTFLDDALNQISLDGSVDQPFLYDFARFLVQDAPDRGPVKFGIALLGRALPERTPAHGDDWHMLAHLGLHEEFTLYAAVALNNLLPEPEAALWDLARKVDGWGKIHLVERLAQAPSPPLQDWLLREGYKNDIMYEYLAYACAVGGDLATALAGAAVDEALFHAAAEILEALILGGPGPSIADYAAAPGVVNNFLRHAAQQPPRLQHFITAAMIRDHLTAARDKTGDEEQIPWPAAAAEAARQAAAAYLDRPVWPDLVRAGLEADDERLFFQADRVAQQLNIDTWRHHWRRLQAEPTQPGRWFAALRAADDHSIDQLVELAITTLPLDEMAPGPGVELGLGPDYLLHNCLDMLAQELRRFPGRGWPLLAAALRSPVVRNRNMALRALAGWERAAWPAAAADALRAALAAEPEDAVRQRIARVLAGEKLE